MDKLKILLVENSRTARAVMSTFLTQAGFDVVSIASGTEVESHISDKNTDVIVMDLFMPAMNGYEVTALIRGSGKPYAAIPIVAYTASQQEQDKIICLDAGMNAFINKSEDNAQLIQWLNDFDTSRNQAQ